MVRTRQYKYMSFPAMKSEMFFDLNQDPGEMKNLVGETALAGRLEEHRKLLAQWKTWTEEEKYPVKAAPGKEPVRNRTDRKAGGVAKAKRPKN